MPSSPSAAVGVPYGCRADGGFAAGTLVEKFSNHQLLCRQHINQRDTSIKVSRHELMASLAALPGPIFDVQLALIHVQ